MADPVSHHGRVWITGAPGAVAAVMDAVAKADPESGARLHPLAADARPGAREPVLVCLDLPAAVARRLPLAGPVGFTSPATLASVPGALERLVAYVRVGGDVSDVSVGGGAREGPVASPAGVPAPRAVEVRLEEALSLLERQIALNADVVALAREMTALAETPGWLVAKLAREPRMRLAALAARLRRRTGGLGAPRRPDLSRRPLGVNVAGYLRAESGMGEAARASIRALDAAGVPVALNDVRGPARTEDESYLRFDDTNPHAVNLVHLNADNMEAFARARGRAYFSDRYTIGYWFWELARFRDDWRPAFDYVHEVWVASAFVRDALVPVSPVPVTCLLPCVHVPEAADVGRSHFGLPDGPFVFLFTFDVSSQFERKNPLGLLRAFRRANLGNDAMLVLKFTNGEANRSAVRSLHEAADGLPVRLIDGYLPRHELAALVRASDGCASLHRSEGFGLTMAESMLLDKPVVATAYSGNLEFMTEETTWLVRHSVVRLERDHGPYLRGFEWAAPDEAHAAALMVDVVRNRDAARERARRGGDHARRLLGVDAAARRVRARLEGIHAAVPGVPTSETGGRLP